MIRLAIGQAIAFAALLVVNMAIQFSRGRFDWSDWMTTAWTLALLPTATGVIIAALANHVKPRLIFCGGAGGFLKPVLGGFFSAVVTVAVAGVVVTFNPVALPDAALLSGLEALMVLGFVLLCRRVSPGRCIRCQYDIRGSTDFGRCPECGQAFFPAIGTHNGSNTFSST